ncbi:cytochrome P450 [Daedalea quercina L-15889]|uniref:Cytochrome P450 n=1 Tax=Daedalea quercina L-15889 TaxID=1314783 RepID=A0A165QF45_9APHY|nr:cytochrome P450 [Daedalea quercina L-15889]
MPFEHPEKLFARWLNVYGDMIFLRVFNTPMLIVNSARAARDLMEKRSAKYSDRPYTVRLIDLMGMDVNIGLMRYDETFRKHRKWIQAPYSDNASLAQYKLVQTRETHALLLNLLHDPKGYLKHLHRFSGASMLETLYGHRAADSDDEYLRLVDEANLFITESSTPGAGLVDLFPILKYTPTWLPGAAFKRLALRARAAFEEASMRTYTLAETTADDKISIIGTIIKECLNKGDLEHQARGIRMLGFAAYSAGTDTTKSVLHSFILAMVLHPDVYTRAQQEMDRLIGNDRLPTFQDRDLLPYLECVLKETYRWACPVCLGVPHASSEDDEYRGYFIPKGTTIVPNLWLMLRDPDMYRDPERFLPERFLDLSVDEVERTDPRNTVFGHGRRICPGRRFADNSLWLAMANLIATFEIRKARDVKGNEITPPAQFESGFTSGPVRFQCSIKPRSQQAVELIASLP